MNPHLLYNLNIAILLRVLLRYLTKGLILTRIETSLSLGMKYNKKSEVITHAPPSGRQPCWNLLPSAISGSRIFLPTGLWRELKRSERPCLAQYSENYKLQTTAATLVTSALSFSKKKKLQETSLKIS